VPVGLAAKAAGTLSLAREQAKLLAVKLTLFDA
jgi:hypothetical protein